MKKASRGYCVLEFDSSSEPASHPRVGDSCVPGVSGTEFEVGGTTSCGQGDGATMNAAMDRESGLG